MRDAIAKFIIRRLNVNPEKKDRVVKKFSVYDRIGKLQPRFLKWGYSRNVYDADGVPLEIYKKKSGGSNKLVLIVHGGAFLMGLINTYRNLHFAITKAVPHAAVAVVDYRIAPQYQYPAAHDDVFKAWEYLNKNLGYNPQDILIMGDSAGGNLVLSLLLKLRDLGMAMPAAAVTMSAWADLLAQGESYMANYNRDLVFGRKKSVPDEQKLQKLLSCGVFSYAGNADRTDPYLSPVLGEYHGMPPMLMTVGSDEMLLDDTLRVAKKIEASGGNVRVIVGEGMFHSYPLYYQISPTAKKSFKEILAFIKERLS